MGGQGGRRPRVHSYSVDAAGWRGLDLVPLSVRDHEVPKGLAQHMRSPFPVADRSNERPVSCPNRQRQSRGAVPCRAAAGTRPGIRVVSERRMGRSRESTQQLPGSGSESIGLGRDGNRTGGNTRPSSLASQRWFEMALWWVLGPSWSTSSAGLSKGRLKRAPRSSRRSGRAKRPMVPGPPGEPKGESRPRRPCRKRACSRSPRTGPLPAFGEGARRRRIAGPELLTDPQPGNPGKGCILD